MNAAEFSADFFDGRTSRRHPVLVGVLPDVLAVRGEGISLMVPRAEVNMHPALGSTPVRVELPGGGLLVARDFEAVDASLGVPRARTLAHRLESHTLFVVVALIGIAAAGWFAYVDGIPWAARVIAERIPPEVEKQLSKEALASADSILFKRSELDPEREAAVRKEFSNLLAVADVPPGVRLELRNGSFLGANAFTLPGGVVVVTDQLIDIMDDREVGAVLAHELGHVRYRHGTRLALHNSANALIAMAVYGDVSAVAGIAATVPTVLMHSGYSRDFEWEADRYAHTLLKRAGRSPLDFATALEALRRNVIQENAKPRRARNMGYLATHPEFEERIEAARDAAR
jgi:Zn-dependent protease with chaperone function